MSMEEVFNPGRCTGEAAVVRGTTSELEAIDEQLSSLQDVSHQIVNHFGNISKSIDGIKFTIRHVILTLEELKQDLAKREAQLIELGDAYADFEQDIERLTTRRDDIARYMAQVFALEAKLEQIRTAMEEQVNLY